MSRGVSGTDSRARKPYRTAGAIGAPPPAHTQNDGLTIEEKIIHSRPTRRFPLRAASGEGMKNSVPEPALLRMPMYIHALKQLRQSDPERVTISATWFQDVLRLNASQVRKDLAYSGLLGRPRVGYVVDDLIEALKRLIGWDDVRAAFLVGAGHLGAALLAHEKIVSHGVKVVAAFDNDPAKIGKTFVTVPTYSIETLPRRARAQKIDIGIIAVPFTHAQHVADLMVEGRIRGIWNFAPIRLNVPEEILVQNEDIFSSVVMLSQRLAPRRRKSGNVRVESDEEPKES